MKNSLLNLIIIKKFRVLFLILFTGNIFYTGCDKGEDYSKTSKHNGEDQEIDTNRKTHDKMKNKKYEDDRYIPLDLEDALNYLEYRTNDEVKSEFMNIEEKEVIAAAHFSWGMYLRNNWWLWSGMSGISLYFKELGIFHADDMSSIILTSYHRRLNGKEINLDEQVRKYIEYWKGSEKKELEKGESEYGNPESRKSKKGKAIIPEDGTK